MLGQISDWEAFQKMSGPALALDFTTLLESLTADPLSRVHTAGLGLHMLGSTALPASKRLSTVLQ